ncbi:MAG: hypothetical protein [Caudoviricetes sp.]|nr:MAG: hypothetical protein [Caudoviricetes sp.]
MMENNHWYDGKTLSDLNHTHVRITLKTGTVVYGDLEIWDNLRIGVNLSSIGWQILALEVTEDGTSLRDEVRSIDRLWDGKIWRRKTEKDNGLADAIYVNNRLYTVDSEEYDENNRTFYEIVNQLSAGGAMVQVRFPYETIVEQLMLVDGHPTDPGMYKGADGSLWCITSRHEYWQIIRPDYIVWSRVRGDIPAEAYPLHRVSDL